MQVSVSSNILNIPRKCACCGGPAEVEADSVASRTTGKRVVKTSTQSYRFCYCNNCLGHSTLYASRWAPLGPALIGGFLFGLFMTNYGGGWFWATMMLAVGGAIFYATQREKQARALMNSRCCAPDGRVGFLWWNGSVRTFEVPSGGYALDLMAANAKKLVNVSLQQQEMLERHLRATAPQPQAFVGGHDAPARRERAAVKPRAESNSVADELGKLAELHRAGVLTDEEFQQQKQAVLGSRPGPANVNTTPPCPNCGTGIANGIGTCPSCGRNLGTVKVGSFDLG